MKQNENLHRYLSPISSTKFCFLSLASPFDSILIPRSMSYVVPFCQFPFPSCFCRAVRAKQGLSVTPTVGLPYCSPDYFFLPSLVSSDWHVHAYRFFSFVFSFSFLFPIL